jgi:acyl carrier protein
MDRQTLLLNYVKSEFLHGRNQTISPEDDLLESGIINSIGLLKMVAYVEDDLGIEVPPEDVIYENFHSVAALSAYLDTRQA